MLKKIFNIIANTFLKLVIVTVVAITFYSFEVVFAQAATLSISPGTGVYTAGQSFTARVVLNTQGAGINAADGTISFNPAELSVVGVSKGTIFNLWTAEPAFSNSAGTITFSGGNPTGYKGGAGTILSITFRAKNAGTSKVNFTKGSALAADGRGTNVLSSMSGGTYTIAAAEVTPEPEVIEYVAPPNTPAKPQVQSSTHPDASKYYANTEAKLSWSLPAGITSVRTLLDSYSGSIPTKVYDTPISEITISDLDDGVQYFHIQFKNEDGWGRVAHYRLAVDTKDPTEFEISLPDGADLSNPEQTLLLKVEDETSVVNHFVVQLDGGEPYEYNDETASGTIILPALEPGQHSVIIEAFDEAGNSIIDTFSFSILAFDKPQFTDYPSEINEEVIPVLKGITRPNSTVEIFVDRSGQERQVYTTTSDEGGIFTFIPDGRFTLGVYEISAVAVDQYGAKSEMSNVIKLAVQEPGLIKVGNWLVSALSIIIPLLSLLALLVLLIVLFFSRLKKMRGGVLRESKEAIKILDTEFVKLQAVVKKQAETLESSRKSKTLTKAESALVEAVTQAVVDAKRRVRKEVEDVEDIVD